MRKLVEVATGNAYNIIVLMFCIITAHFNMLSLNIVLVCRFWIGNSADIIRLLLNVYQNGKANKILLNIFYIKRI